jgi:uncharacterized phage protein gp47/JayE
MPLPVLTFSGLIEQMAAGLQGAAGQLIDLTIGSVLRALLESCATVALWLQWMVLQVLAATRASTSTGAALDSWMADFAFDRLPGAPAYGMVSFGRYTLGLQATIPVGAVLLTADGSQSFTVTEDDTNPAWNGASGYSLLAAQAGIIVPALCSAGGPAGNVQAGAVQVLATPIPGVDFVSNAAAFGGGVTAETDAAFRSRFLLYINSRSLATETAVLNAVASVQPGLRMVVIENVDSHLDPLPGSFLVIADDGTGLPGLSLLQSVQAAVDSVRPIGVRFSVSGPVTVPATVEVVLETSNPITHAAIAANVQQAILAWIPTLPIAGTLAISRIDAIAHLADASVISVTSTLINGASQDLLAPVTGVIVPGSVVVS